MIVSDVNEIDEDYVSIDDELAGISLEGYASNFETDHNALFMRCKSPLLGIAVTGKKVFVPKYNLARLREEGVLELFQGTLDKVIGEWLKKNNLVGCQVPGSSWYDEHSERSPNQIADRLLKSLEKAIDIAIRKSIGMTHPLKNRPPKIKDVKLASSRHLRRATQIAARKIASNEECSTEQKNAANLAATVARNQCRKEERKAHSRCTIKFKVEINKLVPGERWQKARELAGTKKRNSIYLEKDEQRTNDPQELL